MDRHLSLQTYVPRPLADWIKGKARDQQVSVSIVIRDQLIDAWQRENEARKRPAALDPVRQNLFITVALDALLASHTDGSLRQRTHEAYNRRLRSEEHTSELQSLMRISYAVFCLKKKKPKKQNRTKRTQYTIK